MTKEKQIEEMAEIICEHTEFDTMWGECIESAKALYNAGYRKIYDDYQRQCTCYALGCQMAEELKSDVARGIFEEIEKFAEVALMNGHIETPILCIGFGVLAELKKKYTEEE